MRMTIKIHTLNAVSIAWHKIQPTLPIMENRNLETHAFYVRLSAFWVIACELCAKIQKQQQQQKINAEM